MSHELGESVAGVPEALRLLEVYIFALGDDGYVEDVVSLGPFYRRWHCPVNTKRKNALFVRFQIGSQRLRSCASAEVMLSLQ